MLELNKFTPLLLPHLAGTTAEVSIKASCVDLTSKVGKVLGLVKALELTLVLRL
jgi:hypothetical protein